MLQRQAESEYVEDHTPAVKNLAAVALKKEDFCPTVIERRWAESMNDPVNRLMMFVPLLMR